MRGLCFVLARFRRCVLGLCAAPPSMRGARNSKSPILAAAPGAARLFWLPSGGVCAAPSATRVALCLRCACRGTLRSTWMQLHMGCLLSWWRATWVVYRSGVAHRSGSHPNASPSPAVYGVWAFLRASVSALSIVGAWGSSGHLSTLRLLHLRPCQHCQSLCGEMSAPRAAVVLHCKDGTTDSRGAVKEAW